MIPIEPVALSFGAAVLLGLGYGSGPCNIACLPYLGPVFTATGGGVKGAWRTLVPFTLGRVSGYTLLGGLAGSLGLLIEDWLASPWVHWLLGSATLLVALSILINRKRSACNSCSSATVELERGEQSPSRKMLPGGLFLMGLGMALNPCAPLMTVILASATSASMLSGLSLGAGFAFGAVFIPTFIFAFGVAHFGQQIRYYLSRHRIALENSSIALLMMTGAATALGWITP
jgi:sulfite exporter TauE/SafE